MNQESLLGAERDGSGRLRVGTASWTDPTLVKESDWYPKKSMTAEQRLRYYSSIFPMVEVDATYYHPPTRDLAGLWVERTPENFRMDVKAYSLFTLHPAQTRSLWAEVAEALPEDDREKGSTYLTALPDDAVDRAWELFADALLPLYSAGKLGAVFFQFPPWFTPRRDNRDYLRQLPERLPDYPIAVEFRNGRWLAEPDDQRRTLELLESAGLAYVCVDEPQGFPSSVPPTLAVTANLAVLRFHGHNAENWNKKNITPAERFRYLYSQDELEAWAPKVKELAAQARETHVVFNNCYRDYGVNNARQLALLLGEGLQPDAP
jgi:uncharacterized protein YecE (DUF72 family)